MSLWAESLSNSCITATDETSKTQEILRHLSMEVPLSWWQQCINDENIIPQYAVIIFEICHDVIQLKKWNNYALFVALPFTELDNSHPNNYSIKEYRIAANKILQNNSVVNSLGRKVDSYLKKHNMSVDKIKTKKADPQLTGMAGEFLVVGKLFKRKYQASITFGNAKAIDVFVYNPENKQTYSVQVKTLRKKNCFPIKKENISEDHIYVFVFLHEFHADEEFFILKGSEILQDLNKFFGACYIEKDKPCKMPAINYGPLLEYKNRWHLFDQ